MRKLLGAMDKSLAGVENSMIVLLVSLMVLMAFFQVFMRNAFESGILWGDIFLRHLVLWVGFIGASLATRDNKHISIDALSRILSPKALALTKYLTDTVTIVVCAVLAHAGWKFVMYEKESGSTLFKSDWFGEAPAWLFQIIIPVGFAMIGFRFLLKIMERFFNHNTDQHARDALVE